MFTISQTTHRRFVLGRQGLWPGRRWQGKDGTAAALNTCEALQLDPLNIVARSHDIALWGRVLDYQSEFLNELCYVQRQFFDYGGVLCIYPMEELPYWQTPMLRSEQFDRWVKFQQDHPETVKQVLQALEENGPMGNRDFKGNSSLNSYRGTKDTSVALYYLWLTGKVMVHDRPNFQRVYDLRERVVPSTNNYTVDELESEGFFFRKAIALYGMVRVTDWARSVSQSINRRIYKAEALTLLDRLVDEKNAFKVSVEGDKDPYFALTSDLPILETLQVGGIPYSWEPLETSTLEEVTFLAPLEICSARGRAAKLFDFDYVWEVYKPADQRRWGYYVLPILYGDLLAARMDSRLERESGTLQILNFWIEDHLPVEDPAFGRAFGRGLRRFMEYLGAETVELPGTMPDILQQAVKRNC